MSNDNEYKNIIFEMFVKLYCYSAFQNRFTFCFTIIEKHFMIFSKKILIFGENLSILPRFT